MSTSLTSRSARQEAGQAARFLVLGASNSALSIGLYWLLQKLMPIAVAYALAYACGLAFSAAASGQWVFRVNSSRRQFVTAFTTYGAVFLVGLALVWTLQEAFGLPALLAIVLSICVSAPLNYLAGRRIFRSVDRGTAGV